MNEQEFQQLEARVKEGEPLGVVEQLLYDTEVRRRAIGPNVLQQQAAERAKNALLKYRMPQVGARAGLSRGDKTKQE